MLEKYFESKMPRPSSDIAAFPIMRNTVQLWPDVRKHILAYNPREALDEIWSVITEANQFVEERKPWSLAKDPGKKSELTDVICALTECVAHIAVLLQAFMPETAKKILDRLKIASREKIASDRKFREPLVIAGTVIEKGEPLFPRLDEKTS